MRDYFKYIFTITVCVGYVFAPIELYAQSKTETKTLIYEIQIYGETAKDEYVKLYNPFDYTVSLSDWSIQYKSAKGDTFYKKNFPPDSTIPPLGYFLVAHTDYSGKETPDMTHSTFSMASKGGNVYLVKSQKKLTREYDLSEIADRVAWGTGDDPEGVATNANENGNIIYRVNHKDTDDNSVDFSSKENIKRNPDTIENIPTNNVNGNETRTDDEVIDATDKINETIPPDVTTSGNIIINELLPDPYGPDTYSEWIELVNIDTRTIDINGWTISDNSKSHTITIDSIANTIIEQNQFAILSRKKTKIAMNNSGKERITLKDATGKTIDQVEFDKTSNEGTGYALDQYGNWQWTVAITPGSENVIVSEEKEVAKETKKATEDTEETKQPTATPATTKEKVGVVETEKEIAPPESYTSLIVNEILPNPEGSDEDGEWIEFFNSGDTAIPLSGLILGDDSKKTYIIKNGEVGAKEYFVIERVDSKIALNNTGDRVKLWAPDGTLLTSIRYIGQAKSGLSYARADTGLWDWSDNPTPGKANESPEAYDESDMEDMEASAPNSSREQRKNIQSAPDITTIERVKEYDIGTIITTQGTVAVPPDVFGKTYFYITDETSGIKIYSAKKQFPDMEIGDLIMVTGSLSESGNELRVKTSQKDISILGRGDIPKPLNVATSDINEQLEGSLITIEGEIVSTKGSTAYLDDGNDEVRIYIATNTGIKSKDVQQGERYEITGVVSETRTGYRVLPRSPEDIIKIAPKGEVAGASTRNILVKNRSNTKKSYAYLFLGSLLLIVLVFLFDKKQSLLKKIRKQKPE